VELAPSVVSIGERAILAGELGHQNGKDSVVLFQAHFAERNTVNTNFLPWLLVNAVTVHVDFRVSDYPT